MTIDTTSQVLSLASSQLVLGQMNPYVINLLVGGFVLISIIMILIVLIQRPQGGGLGGAFGAGGGGGGGGGGAGQTAFGTKTGDVLTGGTIAIFVMFVVFAVILNFATRPPQAQAPQPTIASPAANESIPVDDGESALDTLGDLVDQNLENGEENDAEEVIDESAPQADPSTEPVADPQPDAQSDEN